MPACTCQHPADAHIGTHWVNEDGTTDHGNLPCMVCYCPDYEAWLVDEKPVEYRKRKTDA
jgi:hypothetical protein